jgi:imidazolonepropionase-like amidohydrolase
MEKAYHAGVKMVMGTDSGIAPHGQNLRELGFLCDIGMGPMEAIQAGTKRLLNFWDGMIKLEPGEGKTG